jgi:hypothetical protein
MPSVRRSHALSGPALAVAATAWLAACVHEYRPPSPREPHAVVTLRLGYHAWPGTELEQLVDLDGQRLRDLPAPTRAGDTVTRPVRARPGTRGWTVQATFFHNNVTSHAETYDTTESAPCGATTCTQIVPRTRLVNQVDRVDDASCSQALRFAAAAGESYVLEYHYLADGRCTLQCFHQLRARGGGSTKAPCPGQKGGN